MIAHLGPFPLEELLALSPAAGALWLALATRVRSSTARRRERASRILDRNVAPTDEFRGPPESVPVMERMHDLHEPRLAGE